MKSFYHKGMEIWRLFGYDPIQEKDDMGKLQIIKPSILKSIFRKRVISINRTTSSMKKRWEERTCVGEKIVALGNQRAIRLTILRGENDTHREADSLPER